MDRIELLLHPIRMRVVLALANRVVTTQQLADMLPDVAQTTLYRHINLLLEGGILSVVRESKVRGTLERELTLVKGAARIDIEESTRLPAETQEQIFTTFIATLLADFRQVQVQPREGVPPAIYTQQRLYLTAEEVREVSEQMDTLLAPYTDPSRQIDGADVQAGHVTAGRVTGGRVEAWRVTGIIMPDNHPKESDKEENQ